MQRMILVTGGTGGLGSAVVRAFLNDGATVITTWRRRDTFTRLASELHNDRLHGAEVNLTDRTNVRAAVAEVVARFGGLDALVHVAGGFAGGATVAETGDDVFDRMFDLNVRSAFVCTGEAMAALADRRGAIVTVASKSALHPGVGSGAYAASKAALVALTQSLAAEGAASGVRANVVLPGTIATDANLDGSDPSTHTDWVRPAELAALIRFLASDAARALNGAAIEV